VGERSHAVNAGPSNVKLWLNQAANRDQEGLPRLTTFNAA
jgi:hypothetical protein